MESLTPEELQDMQAAVSALRLALVSGTLRVTYDGRTVEYRSFAEMKAALRYAEDAIAGPAASQRRPTFATAAFTRG